MPTAKASNLPRISVIIPVFNDEAGLRICLEGIARQSYPTERVEVIAVDNGSTPALKNRPGDPFPMHIVRCTTPGSYAARNAGSRMARGEMFAFIDADCRPDPDWLQQGANCLLSGENKWLVGGDVVFLKPESRRNAVALYQYETGFGQAQNVMNKNFAATANLMCTSQQFETIGPFDERLLSGGDREWVWRGAKSGIGVRFEPKVVVYTRPRATLAGAIRQARRVTAGRMMLRKLELCHEGQAALVKRRSAWASVQWILTRPSLSKFERIRVLCVALLIWGASVFERLRLGMGMRPERR